MTLSNTAIIAPIKVSPHPNADRLQLGEVLGYTVVVGLDVMDGDHGIFFPEGLQLSKEFAEANDLIRRKDPETGKPAGGMFEENRRVRAQKIRGVKSEGFWIEIEAACKLDPGCVWGYNIGDRIDSVFGIPLCNKYVTSSTQSSRVNGKGKIKVRRETEMFKAHFDTDQLRMNKHHLVEGSTIVLTLKMHGTSQRVGRVLDEVSLPWYKRLVNRITRREVFPESQWTYLTGTRNVILRGSNDDSWHGTDFRRKASREFVGRLNKGETIYFEVVGYEHQGKPIMGTHSGDKEIINKYQDPIVYHYGCSPGDHANYVYRITQTNEDGVTTELSWNQVVARCNELNVKHVPHLGTYIYGSNIDEDSLTELINSFNSKPDPIGVTHPTEGVCIRVENSLGRLRIFKEKSWDFKVLEGIVKESDTYVDTEEIA